MEQSTHNRGKGWWIHKNNKIKLLSLQAVSLLNTFLRANKTLKLWEFWPLASYYTSKTKCCHNISSLYNSSDYTMWRFKERWSHKFWYQIMCGRKYMKRTEIMKDNLNCFIVTKAWHGYHSLYKLLHMFMPAR